MRPTKLLVPLLLLCVAVPARAQLRATKSLTLDGAKNIVAAAEAEAPAVEEAPAEAPAPEPAAE